jgi:hypothetical protein
LTKIRFDGRKYPSLVVFLLLTIAMIVTACGNAVPAPVALAAPIATIAPSVAKAPIVTTAPIVKTAPIATTASQANKPNSIVNCDAVYKANYDFGMALAPMVNFTSDTDYTAFTSPDSPFYLDMKKVRSDLDVLATLPDPTDAVELTFGKPSESITYFRQLVDLAESDIKTQGKPFKDTSPSGQKLIGIETPWGQHFTVFGLAMDKACPNYQAPSDLLSGTATP